MNLKNYPNFPHASLLLLILLSIQGILGLVFGIFIALYQYLIGPIQINTIGLAIAINTITFVLVVLIASVIGKINIKEIITFNKQRILEILGICITAAGMVIIVSEIDNIIRYLIPIPDFFMKLLSDIITGDSVILKTILLIVVAPISEEILFRGIILKGFLKNYSPKKAIILSSLFFAVSHLNPIQFISAFIAGLFLGWLYYKNNSLSSCMLAHAVFNSIPLIIITYFKNEFPAGFTSIDLSGPITFQPLLFDFIGIGLVITGMALLIFNYSKNKGLNKTKY